MPRHRRETFMPVLPRLTYCILTPVFVLLSFLITVVEAIRAWLPCLQSLLPAGPLPLAESLRQRRTWRRLRRTIQAKEQSRPMPGLCDNRPPPSSGHGAHLPKPGRLLIEPDHTRRNKKATQKCVLVDANRFSWHPPARNNRFRP